MKLSIIIPIYNVEKYIRACLLSIFNQDIPENEYEVILINDGTLDGSMKIVAEFAYKHKNIIIIEQDNHGLSVARNEGLKIAQGEYLWFIDSDDSIVPDCLGEICELINKYKSDVYVSPLITLDETTGFSGNRNLMCNFGRQTIKGMDFLSLKMDHVPIQIYFIKRTLLIDNSLQFYPGIYHEDMEFAPRMLYYANSVHICEKPYYIYLIRSSGSITSSVDIKHIKDQLIICQLLMEFNIDTIVKEIDRQIFQYLEISLLFSLISHLNEIHDNNQVGDFITKNIKYIRKKGFDALHFKNLRFKFFGLLILIHPQLLMFYRRIK